MVVYLMERPPRGGLSFILHTMLEFSNIRFAYEGASRYALDDVSLQVAPGERVVLLGSNGSGKSTLARLSNATLLPSSGIVLADGHDTSQVDEHAIRELRTLVGVVSQDPENQIVSSTVTDEVAFGPENLGLPREETAARVAEAIEAVGLKGMEAREPHGLSGGEKQRLVIAGILAMRPTYLVFDEPSSMLDSNGRAEVRSIICRLQTQGAGILHITHDLTECAGATRVYVLDSGRLVFEGTPDELLAAPDMLEGHGLVLPPMVRLASLLRARDVQVPAGMLHPNTLAHAVVEYRASLQGR